MDYTSKSQLARIFSEGWVATNGYCLACPSDRLVQTAANTQARDFECESCRHPYELKSSSRPFGSKIVDGAFSSMMRRIENATVPSFLLLQYSIGRAVTDLTAIHHSLITPELIEKRRPLSSTAKRAGWVGCNLLIGGVPAESRVELLRKGIALPKSESRSRFAATEKLGIDTMGEASWTVAVLSCLQRLPSSKFLLGDVYEFEEELAALYPTNHNVKAKIRQQLQQLRDAGLVSFIKRGVYRLSFTPNGGRLN